MNKLLIAALALGALGFVTSATFGSRPGPPAAELRTASCRRRTIASRTRQTSALISSARATGGVAAVRPGAIRVRGATTSGAAILIGTKKGQVRTRTDPVCVSSRQPIASRARQPSVRRLPPPPPSPAKRDACGP